MTFPPPVLPANRTDLTPQLTNHAADHNALATAVNDLTAHVKGIPMIQAKSQVCLVQGGTGWGSFNFDYPFPDGVKPVVVAMNGDHMTGQYTIAGRNTDADGYAFVARNMTASLPGDDFQLRIDYIAVAVIPYP